MLQLINKNADASSSTFSAEDEQLGAILCENVATSIVHYNSERETQSSIAEAKSNLRNLEEQLKNANLETREVISSKGRQEELLRLGSVISSTHELNKLFKTVIEHARDLLDAERATLYLVDEEEKVLWSKVAQGTGEIRIPLGQGLAGEVALTGVTINILDAYEDKRFNREYDASSGYRTKTVLCMPLRNNQGKVVGVGQAINKTIGKFSSEDESLFAALLNQV